MYVEYKYNYTFASKLHSFYQVKGCKKRLKIPTWQSESVNRRRSDNRMA